MNKYLYGASVQGIQDFIFKTNKLKEIVGASEIIKNISKVFEDNFNSNEILVNAAGNIKAVFVDENECKRAVMEFSKLIQQKAYGITISQAVVVFKDDHTQSDINKLEKKLKIQRNKPSIPLDLSLNVMELNPTTGKPKLYKDIDKATKQKVDAYKSIEINENKNLHTISNNKKKLAVIHIDGNGLGQLIPNLKMPLSEFSKKLDKATEEAFQIAKGNKNLREIILGGDDVTVICDANDALSFTKEFLENFENETKKFLDDKITACAGIAFTNEKYPFHYAINLAEALCGETKKHAKQINQTLAPSSLMFHNIQSSNFQSWNKFVEDELTITNDEKTINCDFGPYYLSEINKPTIENFINLTESLRLKDSPSSKLRSWLGELYTSDKNAKNFLDRIDNMADLNKKYKKSILNRNFENLHPDLKLNNLITQNKTPVYDILQILSVTDTGAK